MVGLVPSAPITPNVSDSKKISKSPGKKCHSLSMSTTKIKGTSKGVDINGRGSSGNSNRSVSTTGAMRTIDLQDIPELVMTRPSPSSRGAKVSLVKPK